MAFGERLAAVRRGSGLTQEQFAAQLQVSRQAVSKWESGRGYPEIEKILYICNRYHVSIAELFAEEAPVPLSASQESPSEEKPLPRATLRRAVGAFLTNLSPKNKWLAGAVLAGIGILAGILGLILKGGSADMAATIWIAAIIIFGAAEAATAGLTSIWFVLGSVAGLIAAVCGGAIWLQVGLFFAVSIAALAFTRPLAVRWMNKDIKPTNADRVLGAVGRVTERIDNALPSGAVYIDGKTWTARSDDGGVIEPDTAVRILRMAGVKLIVRCEVPSGEAN